MTTVQHAHVRSSAGAGTGETSLGFPGGRTGAKIAVAVDGNEEEGPSSGDFPPPGPALDEAVAADPERGTGAGDG